MCSSVEFAENEYIDSITTWFNQWYGQITELDIKTSKGESYRLGKTKGYQETFTFTLFEPFIGFYAIKDPFTFVVEQLGVYTEQCSQDVLLDELFPFNSSIGGVNFPDANEVLGMNTVAPNNLPVR